MGVIRKTKGVKKVLNLFNSEVKAILAVDLIEQLKGDMNKTTVYRILERLESEGILHSFLGKNGLKWYAKCSGCSTNNHNDVHPHFQCKTCDKVTCISIDITIPKINNYQIESATVFLTGTCNDCL